MILSAKWLRYESCGGFSIFDPHFVVSLKDAPAFPNDPVVAPRCEINLNDQSQLVVYADAHQVYEDILAALESEKPTAAPQFAGLSIRGCGVESAVVPGMPDMVIIRRDFANGSKITKDYRIEPPG